MSYLPALTNYPKDKIDARLTLEASDSGWEAVAGESISALASETISNGGSIDDVGVGGTGGVGRVSGNSPFELNTADSGAAAGNNNPRGESPAAVFGESGEAIAGAPGAAVGEGIAAGGVAGGAAVAGRHERGPLAVGFAEGGIFAVVQIKDVVGGDGEVLIGGEGEGPEVVVVAAEGGVGEVEEEAVGEEAEDAVGARGDGEEERGGVDAGEAESVMEWRGGVEVEGERDVEGAALRGREDYWSVEEEEREEPRRHGIGEMEGGKGNGKKMKGKWRKGCCWSEGEKTVGLRNGTHPYLCNCAIPVRRGTWDLGLGNTPTNSIFSYSLRSIVVEAFLFGTEIKKKLC